MIKLAYIKSNYEFLNTYKFGKYKIQANRLGAYNVSLVNSYFYSRSAFMFKYKTKNITSIYMDCQSEASYHPFLPKWLLIGGTCLYCCKKIDNNNFKIINYFD